LNLSVFVPLRQFIKDGMDYRSFLQSCESSTRTIHTYSAHSKNGPNLN
jgi:hypothetical protein